MNSQQDVINYSLQSHNDGMFWGFQGRDWSVPGCDTMQHSRLKEQGPKLTLKWLVSISTLLPHIPIGHIPCYLQCDSLISFPQSLHLNLKSISSALKMETGHSSRRAVSAYKTKWCKNLKNYNVNCNMCL